MERKEGKTQEKLFHWKTAVETEEENGILKPKLHHAGKKIGSNFL